MNYQQSKRHQRREFFNQHYRMVWKESKVLSPLERQLIDFSFGLSGEVKNHRELAEEFNFENFRQVNRIIHCALNKLRKERELRRYLSQ